MIDLSKADVSVAQIVSHDLDARLDRIGATISDAVLLMEAELNAATTVYDVQTVELCAARNRLLLEHVQTAAWEKAKAIQ